MSNQEEVTTVDNAAEERRQKINQVFDELKQIYENGTPIEVEINSIVKGGFRTLYKELPIFLPFKQFSKVRNISEEELSNEIGKSIKVAIIDFTEDEFAKVVKISKTKLDEDELWKDIAEGKEVSGKVKAIVSQGIIFDINGLEGFAPISQLSRHRINDINAFANIGDVFNTKIINVDRTRNKITLSLKNTHVPDFNKEFAELAVGNRIKGKIKNVTRNGIFVEVLPNIDGFLHISEMSWTKRNMDLSTEYVAGNEIEAEIIELNSNEGKISLSYRRTIPNNWVEIADRYNLDNEYAGVVTSINKNGVIVCLNEEIEGFMPKGRMKAFLNGEKIMLNNFDIVQVKILEKDAEKYSLIFESTVVPERSEKPDRDRNKRNNNYSDNSFDRKHIGGNKTGYREYSFADILSESSKKALKKK